MPDDERSKWRVFNYRTQIKAFEIMIKLNQDLFVLASGRAQ